MSTDERAKRDARIVELADSGLTISQLRERFGLTNQHIQSILRRADMGARNMTRMTTRGRIVALITIGAGLLMLAFTIESCVNRTSKHEYLWQEGI